MASRIESAQITHETEQMTVEGGVLTIAINGGVTVNDATSSTSSTES